ncbi:MAG: VTT domain-containing protein [Anaerolineae bacterium]|nr:VTT domain-containing protein [Anaerolineae bacterium]
MDLEAFLDAYGLLAIFGIMLLKSIGIPIPIPADVIMLGASARAAGGRLSVTSAFLALLLALSVGGLIQFSLVRGVGRGLLLRYGRLLGITAERLDAVARRLQKGGVLGIGIAILTPGIRSVTIPACGIAGIELLRFAGGLILGSGMFLALHFALGLLGGTALSGLGVTLSPPMAILLVLAALALGLAAWMVIRRRQHPEASAREALASAVGAWHEATCPACLALGATRVLQIDLSGGGHIHEGGA